MVLSLRSVNTDDESFLFVVYASTRLGEMAFVNWNDAEKNAFLGMQFRAQRQSYERDFPNAEWKVILKDDLPIGRLIVDRSGDHINLMDIALLPEFRNIGIGSSLIRDLQAEAKQTNRLVRLHVESFNPAFRLYERCGFKKVSEHGFYNLMEWQFESEHPAAKVGQ